MVSGRSKQANIHTYVRNEVTPVWSSLRLAAMIRLYLQLRQVFESHFIPTMRESEEMRAVLGTLLRSKDEGVRGNVSGIRDVIEEQGFDRM